MAEGKPSARDSGSRKAPKTSTRVPNGTAGAAPKSTHGVSKHTQGVPKNTQGIPDPRKSAKKPVDEMEGLFVDPEPQSSKKSKAARASDRRRERGHAPQPAGVPDTRTSMPARDPPAPSVKSQMSDMKGLARATLTCTRGPEEGLSVNLIEGSYTVGRARENSFVLKDIAASRRHLRIDVDGRGARVIDLGSGNGSRVNGRRISEHELRHGDRIEIGGSVLLYQERGKGPVEQQQVSAPVDDAQERVIRAAEKLAAELSERMRFGDDGPQGSFEDGHVAKTRAIPQAQKKEIEAELARVKAAQAAQSAQGRMAPEKLWKETFTNLPLDRVVPAEEPLRGGARAAEQMPSQPMMVPVAVRAPLPRPAPLPMPPPPDEEYDVSGSQSRGGSSSFMVSLLVTALVVLLGGGGVLIAFMVTHHRSAASATTETSDEEVQKAYDEAMAGYDKAADVGEWVSALDFASIAVRNRPNDKAAVRAQKEARMHLDEQKKPTLTPTTAAPATTAPSTGATGATGATTEAQTPPSPPPVASAPPPPKPAPPPPAASPPRSRAKASSSSSSSASREREREREAPPPKPRRSNARTMSDEQAQAKFQEAVDALRQKDNKTGCKTLEEIADRAPAESRWQEKALNLYNRRCGD